MWIRIAFSTPYRATSLAYALYSLQSRRAVEAGVAPLFRHLVIQHKYIGVYVLTAEQNGHSVPPCQCFVRVLPLFLSWRAPRTYEYMTLVEPCCAELEDLLVEIHSLMYLVVLIVMMARLKGIHSVELDDETMLSESLKYLTRTDVSADVATLEPFVLDVLTEEPSLICGRQSHIP